MDVVDVMIDPAEIVQYEPVGIDQAIPSRFASTTIRLHDYKLFHTDESKIKTDSQNHSSDSSHELFSRSRFGTTDGHPAFPR